MKILLLIVPFILLLVPTAAVEGYVEDVMIEYYFKSGITSTDQFRIMKIFYDKDQYGDKIRFTYEVPSWSYNIEIWYNQGLIDYTTQQNAFDYLVYSDIANPRY